MIQTFLLWRLVDDNVLSNLFVIDENESGGDQQYHYTITAGEGTLSLGATFVQTLQGDAALFNINDALNDGVTYRPSDVPSASPTDKVTLTVEDSHVRSARSISSSM